MFTDSQQWFPAVIRRVISVGKAGHPPRKDHGTTSFRILYVRHYGFVVNLKQGCEQYDCKPMREWCHLQVEKMSDGTSKPEAMEACSSALHLPAK